MVNFTATISINGGVQLDLMGQENAESTGTRQLSGVGGQIIIKNIVTIQTPIRKTVANAT